jgi:hypothetical protein
MKVYCMDCKYLRRDNASILALPDLCIHEESRDLVGYFRTPGEMRAAAAECGPEGLLYEENECELPAPRPKRVPLRCRIFGHNLFSIEPGRGVAGPMRCMRCPYEMPGIVWPHKES